MLSEDAVDDLGDHAVAVSQNAGEQFLPRADLGDEVLPKLVFDRKGLVAGFLELAEGRCFGVLRHRRMLGAGPLAEGVLPVRNA